MNTRVRGLIIFGVIIGVLTLCAWLSFSFLPGNGVGGTLPVIEVPGEVVVEGGFFGLNLTNTIMGTLFADFMVFLFAFLAWRASKGWTREVPGRFQGLVEVLVGGLYNFLKGIAGERLNAKRPVPLWPLVATMFLFLLAANYMKLFPGVETVGKMHCAYPGQSGYPIVQGAMSDTSWVLYSDRIFNAGTQQTAETEAICNAYFKKAKYGEEVTVSPEVVADLQAEIAALDSRIAELDARIAAAESAAPAEEADDHGGESASTATEAAADEAAAEGDEAADGEATTAEAEEAAEAEETLVETVTPVVPAASVTVLRAERDALVTARDLANTRTVYPDAILPLTQEQLDRGVIPYIFHITPFFRGPTTDLSLTFALAILSIVLVQAYGVAALGPAYFEKFINISALGNLGKRPLGAIDFIVGLIEIISEIGKIVSLAFRLFGNLFAGGVALMAVSFLVTVLVPGIILGLEIIIGTVQALVFAVLTTVFAAQAMESHGHHDDEHGHEGEHAH